MAKTKPYPELRTQIVNKANVIIQKARYSLPLSHQKIILFLIANVKPTDDEFKTLTLRIQDFCRFCGIQVSGKNYADLKAAMKKVADQSFYVEEDGVEKLVRWLDMVHIHHGEGTVELRIHPEMRPYLLHLNANFTHYELVWISRFRSRYSPRLYELLKSYHYRKREKYEREFDVEELKKAIGAEGYERWINFRQKALDPSVADINQFSDMLVSYTPVKRGRKICGVKFTMSTKADRALYKLRRDTEAALGIDPDQLIMFNYLVPAEPGEDASGPSQVEVAQWEDEA